MTALSFNSFSYIQNPLRNKRTDPASDGLSAAVCALPDLDAIICLVKKNTILKFDKIRPIKTNVFDRQTKLTNIMPGMKKRNVKNGEGMSQNQ
ncbi:hypothetical protein SDC9_100290 [bioreactor metagenome]|uniref:Uncharacterized protein n=1 Tax=bioreactor metagenome TaxID=1076179 RepID=A0A645AJX6_9ZZZZ